MQNYSYRASNLINLIHFPKWLRRLIDVCNVYRNDCDLNFKLSLTKMLPIGTFGLIPGTILWQQRCHSSPEKRKSWNFKPLQNQIETRGYLRPPALSEPIWVLLEQCQRRPSLSRGVFPSPLCSSSSPCPAKNWSRSALVKIVFKFELFLIRALADYSASENLRVHMNDLQR